LFAAMAPVAERQTNETAAAIANVFLRPFMFSSFFYLLGYSGFFLMKSFN